MDCIIYLLSSYQKKHCSVFASQPHGRSCSLCPSYRKQLSKKSLSERCRGRSAGGLWIPLWSFWYQILFLSTELPLYPACHDLNTDIRREGINRTACVSFSVENKLHDISFPWADRSWKPEEAVLLHLVGTCYSSWPKGGGKNTGLRAGEPGVHSYLALTGHITLERSLLFSTLNFQLWYDEMITKASPKYDTLRSWKPQEEGWVTWQTSKYYTHTQLSICQEVSSYHYYRKLLSGPYNCL